MILKGKLLKDYSQLGLYIIVGTYVHPMLASIIESACPNDSLTCNNYRRAGTKFTTAATFTAAAITTV